MASRKFHGGRRGRVGMVAVALALALLAAACSGDEQAEAGDLGLDDTADNGGSVAAASSDLQTTVAPSDAAEPPDETARSGVGSATPTGDGADLDEAAFEAFLAARYEAFWTVYDLARSAPTLDPARDFPNLADLAAGEQLSVSYESVTALAELGEAIREPDTPAIAGVDAGAEHRVRIDEVDGTVAELSGCVVNDDVRHVVASDAVVRDTVSTVMSVSTMALTEGEWKLIRSRAVEIQDGVTGCWLTDDSEFPH